MLKHKVWKVLLVAVSVLAFASIALWLRVRLANARLVENILTDSPYAPPCWQGITPGDVVDRRAIIRQLRRTPGIGTVWESTGRAVDWHWGRWPGYNHMYIERDGTVYNISLSVDFVLTVEEVIAKYGLPDAVNVVVAGVPEDQYGAMSLFYPRYGIDCHVKVLPDYAPVLRPDSVIYEVNYTVPASSIEAWLGEGATDAMHLQPWPGYGELEVLGP